MQKAITYFERPGEDNTSAVFDLVDAALAENGITKIVLASTRGTTARHAMDRYKGKGVTLVIVPHQYGFGPTGEQRFDQELGERAAAEGHHVYYGTMLFHQEKLWGDGAPQVVANVLRFFCEGVKVCVETLLMAANGELVSAGEQVVVAGTGRGADTALIMTGGTTRAPKRVHISQMLCKPL